MAGPLFHVKQWAEGGALRSLFARCGTVVVPHRHCIWLREEKSDAFI